MPNTAHNTSDFLKEHLHPESDFAKKYNKFNTLGTVHSTIRHAGHIEDFVTTKSDEGQRTLESNVKWLRYQWENAGKRLRERLAKYQDK